MALFCHNMCMPDLMTAANRYLINKYIIHKANKMAPDHYTHTEETPGVIALLWNTEILQMTA